MILIRYGMLRPKFREKLPDRPASPGACILQPLADPLAHIGLRRDV